MVTRVKGKDLEGMTTTTAASGTAYGVRDDGTYGKVLAGGGGGGGISDITAGTNISIDKTNPSNPTISASVNTGQTILMESIYGSWDYPLFSVVSKRYMDGCPIGAGNTNMLIPLGAKHSTQTKYTTSIMGCQYCPVSQGTLKIRTYLNGNLSNALANTITFSVHEVDDDGIITTPDLFTKSLTSADYMHPSYEYFQIDIPDVGVNKVLGFEFSVNNTSSTDFFSFYLSTDISAGPKWYTIYGEDSYQYPKYVPLLMYLDVDNDTGLMQIPYYACYKNNNARIISALSSGASWNFQNQTVQFTTDVWNTIATINPGDISGCSLSIYAVISNAGTNSHKWRILTRDGTYDYGEIAQENGFAIINVGFQGRDSLGPINLQCCGVTNETLSGVDISFIWGPQYIIHGYKVLYNDNGHLLLSGAVNDAYLSIDGATYSKTRVSGNTIIGKGLYDLYSKDIFFDGIHYYSYMYMPLSYMYGYSFDTYFPAQQTNVYEYSISGNSWLGAANIMLYKRISGGGSLVDNLYSNEGNGYNYDNNRYSLSSENIHIGDGDILYVSFVSEYDFTNKYGYSPSCTLYFTNK